MSLFSFVSLIRKSVNCINLLKEPVLDFMGFFFPFSEPHFLHLENGHDNSCLSGGCENKLSSNKCLLRVFVPAPILDPGDTAAEEMGRVLAPKGQIHLDNAWLTPSKCSIKRLGIRIQD